MATPTPSTNTPQKHLAAFSSPAPRSVPPMMNYDSPAVLTMLNEGSVGMGISMSGMGMSQLGLSASAMGRADEDERRRRLENIIATLKTKPGRVGEEGITALCKKEGLDVDREVLPDGSVMLTLIIGSETICDIPIRNGEIQSVNLQIASDGDEDMSFGASGSKILRKSLRPLPGQSKINLTLDRFSHNLDKLLRMDKLSAPENGGVNCYKAIFGVYKSLRKLFEHEKKMALALVEANAPFASLKAEREVLCKKSGRPRINSGDCMGLSLEYWMDRRHIIPPKVAPQPSSAKGKQKVAPDAAAEDEEDAYDDPSTNTIYSLTIECESSPSSMFTPIRISDAWLSDSIYKPADTDMSTLLLAPPQPDWLVPEPTYLQPPPTSHDDDSADPSAMTLDATPGRLPNIRFTARFNPPLILPLSVAVSLQQSVGLDMHTQDIRPTTFVGLALRPGDVDPGMMGLAGASTDEVRSTTSVVVPGSDGGEQRERVRTHANALCVPRTEYARAVEALPFQHPRQLVEMLPVLRQYAFVTSLLRGTFDKVEKAQPATPLSPPLTPKTAHGGEGTGDGKAEDAPLHLDVALSYAHPTPRLSFTIPHPSATSPAPLRLSTSPSSSSPSPSPPTALLSALLSRSSTTITDTDTAPPLRAIIEVHPNAELLVSEQNIVAVEGGLAGSATGGDILDVDAHVDMQRAAEAGERVKRIARALDVCQDVGVWGEWVRREVAVVRGA
ncbi:mediator of RNA polymerase II transcription subunit 1-domain-containing protein [Massariosphaeria phaeospora]|uniref:Mediator of RNA polymerase II transcription subunit 1 n=1 Tax=Massariosphaeria phaeospora TaxID=100035 RepID=A0A7C8IA91_9PLEO|nr:mediator of RNA polymerase II transcription subunit 1-domain-containing protein [Massariosphaeria phaeospora]